VCCLLFTFSSIDSAFSHHLQREKEFADSIGVGFIETSALNSTNVDDAFLALARSIKKKVLRFRYLLDCFRRHALHLNLYPSFVANSAWTVFVAELQRINSHFDRSDLFPPFPSPFEILFGNTLFRSYQTCFFPHSEMLKLAAFCCVPALACVWHLDLVPPSAISCSLIDLFFTTDMHSHLANWISSSLTQWFFLLYLHHLANFHCYTFGSVLAPAIAGHSRPFLKFWLCLRHRFLDVLIILALGFALANCHRTLALSSPQSMLPIARWS
jgi:hypothetical protein